MEDIQSAIKDEIRRRSSTIKSVPKIKQTNTGSSEIAGKFDDHTRHNYPSTEVNITESYRILSESKGGIPKPSFKDIERAVSAINTVQREYERLQTRENSKGLGRVMYAAFDAIGEGSGMRARPRSALELFNSQIENVSDLNRMLGSLILYGSSERDLIRKRTDEVIGIANSAHSEMSKYKGILPEQIKKLEGHRDELGKKSPADNDYFMQKRELIGLEREVSDNYARFIRVQQKYTGVSEHMNNLELMEKIFSAYLNTGAELAVITEQIGQTLRDNHRILGGSEMIAGAAVAVSGSIDILAEYNRQMTESFTQGVQRMQQMIYGHENIGMISSSNASLRGIIQDIESVDFYKNKALEEHVADIR